MKAVLAGRLERVMPDWSLGAAHVVALVPTRKGRSPRTQAFITFLRETAQEQTQGSAKESQQKST